MRAIRVHEHGGPEVLRLDMVDDPVPGPGVHDPGARHRERLNDGARQAGARRLPRRASVPAAEDARGP